MQRNKIVLRNVNQQLLFQEVLNILMGLQTIHALKREYEFAPRDMYSVNGDNVQVTKCAPFGLGRLLGAFAIKELNCKTQNLVNV